MTPMIINDPGGVFSYRGDPGGLAVRTYWRGDEWAVSARADFARAFADDGRLLPAGPKWTLTDRAKILGVGGFEPLGDRTYGAWAYCSELTPRQWLFGGRVAAELSRRLKVFSPRARIHAIAAETPEARRLLEHMGFAARVPTLGLFTYEKAA